MYTQRLPALGEAINEWGCALMSIVAAVSVLRPHAHLSPRHVKGIVNRAQREGAIDDEISILRWGRVFEMLGIDVQYHGHIRRDWIPGDGELAITKWVLKIPHENIDWTHFTLGDGAGKDHPFYDPWGAATGYRTSRTVAEGVMDSKRGFSISEE